MTDRTQEEPTTMQTEYTIGEGPDGTITIDVELTADRFSVSASTRHQGGQMQDTIREWADRDQITYADGWNTDRLERLLLAWDTWHLNDLQAGCEHQRAAGWDRRPIDDSKPTRAYGKHFEGQRTDSWNLLTWVRPSEHPDGLMTRPCPICGYRYGTAWLSEPLPDALREMVDHGFAR